MFGPPVGKQCVIFVDDLNMPLKEKYGAQPPIELLRQWIDQGNWYDKKDTSKIELIDMILFSCMGPPGGGRNHITGRLTRHMNIITTDSFSDDTMSKIFTSIVDWHFSHGFDSQFLRAGKLVVQATLDVYKQAIEIFLPTPSKSHYLFNLRDFGRVVKGILLAPSSTMKDEKKLYRLWIHEVYRVFHDRLIDEHDRLSFFDLVKNVVADALKTDINKLLEHLVPPNTKLSDDHIRNLMFGDFGSPDGDKVYNEIASLDELSKVMEGYYNISS